MSSHSASLAHMRRPIGRYSAVVIDCLCVLVFVVIGRASHTTGDTLGGIASTAWPFLCGLLCGWVTARAWRRPLALAPAGVGAWLGTVVIGMLLRLVAGQGTAIAFVIVALAFLGLFLLGWRAVVHLGNWLRSGGLDRGRRRFRTLDDFGARRLRLRGPRFRLLS